MPPSLRLLVVGFAALAGAAALAAEAPSAWRARLWQVEDGLPDNRVVGLAQTDDGYLWVATREGLVRFNGARFEPFSPGSARGVTGGGIRAMFADRRDHLWLDTFRETIVRVGPEALQVCTSREGVPAGELAAFADDAAGRAWLTLGGRLCLVEDGRVRAMDINATSLARDARGRVWCATNEQVGWLSDGRFERRFAASDRSIVLAPAQAGGIWVCAGSQLLRVGDAGAPELRHRLAPGIRPRCLLEDRSRAVWIGTVAHGLIRYDGKTAEEIETSHRSISSLLEDREGNIWVGTLGGGLNRLRPRAFELTGLQAGLPFDALVSVCEDAEGRLWAATERGQLARGDGNSWSLLDAGERWPGGNASCVAADRQGHVWIGTRGQGLHRIGLRDGSMRTWRLQDGLPGNNIRALFVAADDTVWAATSEPASLVGVSGGGVRVMAAPGDVRTFRAITQDARGDIWVGTSEGRVLKAVGDRLDSEPLLADATLSSVRALHATPDGSLWVGYAGRGVSWLKDGRLTRFSTANGLAHNSIWQITSDAGGFLWIAGPSGLSRVAAADVRAVAEGRQERIHPTLFGRGEGLRSFQAHYGNAPAVCRTRDGRILFATSQGLLILDPNRLRENLLPPPVVLEQVTVDDRVSALSGSRFPLRPDVPRDVVEIRSAGARLRVPPGHRRLAFDFAALSFSAPENVRFRYRLDGLDDAWTESGGERSARYPRLPAGDYVFRVAACNDMGVWNERGALLAVTVDPFFWQTWWFRLGLLAGFTGAVVAVVRLVSYRRLRRRLQQAEQMSALSQERARIARDIHDDLGGSLAHVKLLSELATRERAAPEPGEDYLGQITATTRQMLKSLDEIVWAINPRNDTLPNLVGYLGQYAVEFLRAAGLRCQIDLPDNPPEVAVPSDVRHHLFLVLKEALTNSVRHAQARSVRVWAQVAAAHLEIGLEDDGRGFDLAAAETQGDGLRNMRQRMAAVGGTFELASTPGAGTRLRLRIALPPAAGVGRSSD
jgi:signal transduction histidine kinase/ligand-binding sensor domain-containing protein